MRLLLTLLLFLAILSGGAQTVPEATKTKLPDSNSVKKVLVFINGIEQKMNNLKQLDSLLKPEDIESLKILDGKSAIDKYGDKAKDGVVEIITKINAGKTKDQKAEDVTDDDNIIFTKPEVEASFPGGPPNWKIFLQTNLNANVPVKNKAPVGKYTVIIQFIVDKSGKTSDFRALTNHGFGMEGECIRVLKLSPPWIPATQNGYKVKVFQKQPITFFVGKE